MGTNAGPCFIVGYEIGFEGEVNWEKPVLFNIALIDRIDKSPCGHARFSVSRSVIEPVEFMTKSCFEDIAARLDAIQ